MTAPDSTVRIGGIARLQRLCVWSAVRVCCGSGVGDTSSPSAISSAAPVPSPGAQPVARTSERSETPAETLPAAITVRSRP